MQKILYQNINSFDTSVLKDMILRGQITIERATSISVEVQLRHTSDKPVPERVDDKFKKVLRNVYKMLEKAQTYLTQVMKSANQLPIRIQVQNSYLESPKSSENIRTKISSNYKNILGEMQLSLARENPSRCTGNVADILKKIAPESGSPTQRMCDVLRFIFQHKRNRVQFEKILKENGLKNVTNTWTEDIELGNLRVLLESFHIVVPHSSRESFVKTLLDETLLKECVYKVRSLARRVVLCKNFDEKNKKQNPGTVMVYEVIVMNEDNEVFIYEKDPKYWSAFFEEKREKDLVKVILIEGIWQNVSKTKEKVYQKYQKYIDSGKFHLHHESEQYSEIAKISALQSIKLCQQYVESVRASIPLDTIDDIVKKSMYRALTEERIKEMCCNTYIDGVGTANDDPYFVRFFLTLNRIKGEIKQKTIESMKERLQSELCVEITRHINLELQSKFELATVSLAIHHISGMLLVLIASLLNPIAGAVVAVVTGLVSLVIGQDVNSRRWREKIAMEISDEISKQRVQISKKLSSHLLTIFHETSDNLKNVSEYLEDYRRRIAYTD